MNNKNLKSGSAHPPLSGKSLTGSGFQVSEKPIFEGKNCQRGTINVMLNSFQHLMFVSPDNKEIPKPVRNDNRVCAFTLAEVLITLVIIGVVAALTIPNLMQKYTEQTTVKKVQKFYSNLSNAYSLAIKDNGKINDWGLTTDTQENAVKIYEILFKPYFKIAKNCGKSNTDNCIINTRYKALNNQVVESSLFGISSAWYKFVLDDGSAVIFYATANLLIYYDINGIKGPNQWGVDTFYFTSDYVQNKDRIIAWGLPGFSYYDFETYCKKNSQYNDSGRTCAAWVIYKGNMDYLHCDDLSWTGKDKCK